MINWQKRYHQILKIQKRWANKWLACKDKDKIMYKLNQVGLCSELLTQITIKSSRKSYDDKTLLELKKNQRLLKQKIGANREVKLTCKGNNGFRI